MVETDDQKRDPSESTSGPDWEDRVLCSDESCIGIIGADGRCRVCGKPADPGTQGAPHPDDTPGAAPSPESPAAPEGEGDPESGDAQSNTDLAWEERVLCSDESCIGVIGADGRCRVCGKPPVPPQV